MYETLLFLHSGLRWLVLLAAFFIFARCLYGVRRRQVISARDERALWVFNQVIQLQFLLGATLWGAASPFVRAAFADKKLLLESEIMSFWVLRHPITMILALGIFHVGRARARRREPAAQFRVYAITLGVFLGAIASAIPWPFLAVGRPLFRSY